jgi:hypothetical protein
MVAIAYQRRAVQVELFFSFSSSWYFAFGRSPKRAIHPAD